MNHFHAMAEWRDGAWRARVRFSHKAGYHDVMDGDVPAAFPTSEAAEIAALRAQEKHMNSTIRGFGERVGAAKANAEKLFRPGKKPIAIEAR